MELEQPNNIDQNEDAVSAIASMMSEEAEPEATAMVDEPEETTSSENEPEPTGDGEDSNPRHLSGETITEKWFPDSGLPGT